MSDVLVLINRTHEPFEEFVRHIFEPASERFNVSFGWRKSDPVMTSLSFLFVLLRSRPDVVWIVGSGLASVVASIVARLLPGTTLVFFHNDFTYQKMRDIPVDDVNWLRLQIERIQEGWPLYLADEIVTMSAYHEEYLHEKGIRKPFLRIPHGVDIEVFHPDRETNVYEELGLEDQIAVGIVATFNWSENQRIGYGWSLIEGLQYLDDEPITAVFIGGGDGIEHLRTRAEELGVADSTTFTGQVPHDRVPEYTAALDIGMLVLTDHPADRMKPTMKLPEYLASGLYIIADDNGVASSVLNHEYSSIIEYEGIRDEDFPPKLAAELRFLANNPGQIRDGAKHSREVAEQRFAYEILQERILTWLDNHLENELWSVP